MNYVYYLIRSKYEMKLKNKTPPSHAHTHTNKYAKSQEKIMISVVYRANDDVNVAIIIAPDKTGFGRQPGGNYT